MNLRFDKLGPNRAQGIDGSVFVFTDLRCIAHKLGGDICSEPPFAALMGHGFARDAVGSENYHGCARFARADQRLKI